jgi:hypothetical protein
VTIKKSHIPVFLQALHHKKYKNSHEQILRDLQKFIPEGIYCYELKNEKRVLCPFWSFKKNKHHQENGFCSYLNKGDWQKNGTFLLWDACKECGINDDWEEEDEINNRDSK